MSCLIRKLPDLNFQLKYETRFQAWTVPNNNGKYEQGTHMHLTFNTGVRNIAGSPLRSYILKHHILEMKLNFKLHLIKVDYRIVESEVLIGL